MWRKQCYEAMLAYPLPLYWTQIMQPVTLDIEGMSCSHCLNAVNRALSALPGVEIDSIAIGRADVRFDEAVTSPAQLEAAIGNAGYRATIRP